MSAQRRLNLLMQNAGRHAGWFLAAVGAIWFIMLLASANYTKQAFVFGDEAGYLLPILYGANASNYAIWRHLVEYPSHLYFSMYGALPGDGSNGWIKALNAAFLAGAALPSFIVARRYVTANHAAIFACVVIATPLSSFVRYVMPEPMFFFGFWFCLALITSTIDRSAALSALLGGISFGLLSLVKPHAFALSLGFGVFLLLYRPRWRNIGLSLLQVASCYLVHLVVKLALTGRWVWSVSTGNYTGLTTVQIDWVATLVNAAGHAFAICALVAVPAALAVNEIRRHASGQPTDRRQYELALLSLGLLAAMVAMTVYFSQKVYQFAPEAERITRLHGRYYVYVLPLLALLGIRIWQRHAFSLPLIYARLSLGLSALGATLIVWRYEVGPVDYPDMTLWGGRSLIYLSCSVVAAQLALFGCSFLMASTRRVLQIWFAWIVTMTAGAAMLLTVVAPLRSPRLTAIDQVFIHLDDPVRKLIGRADGVIVGAPDGGGDLPRVMFYMRSMSKGQVAVPDGSVGDAEMPPGVNWALLLPGVRYSGAQPVIAAGELKIVWFDGYRSGSNN